MEIEGVEKGKIPGAFSRGGTTYWKGLERDIIIILNVINIDKLNMRIVLNDKLVKARSKARGVSEAKYMRDNLLGLEVRASDVAQAFLTLALAERTTGNIIAVDGGNIAAAPR